MGFLDLGHIDNAFCNFCCVNKIVILRLCSFISPDIMTLVT
jgi:hypothetical protein